MAPGDPKRMTAWIIESVNIHPAPLHIILGSVALSATIEAVKSRLVDFATLTEVAASTDYPEGE